MLQKIDPMLLALIQKEAEKIATKIVQEELTRYGIGQNAIHAHNGLDSPKLPSSSLSDFEPLSSVGGGVLDPALYNNNTEQPKAIVYSYPKHVIYGSGVGVYSQFNGGNAPEGTSVIFRNTSLPLHQLWFKVPTFGAGLEWVGVTLDQSY